MQLRDPASHLLWLQGVHFARQILPETNQFLPRRPQDSLNRQFDGLVLPGCRMYPSHHTVIAMPFLPVILHRVGPISVA
jgi:hypothetical protein